MKREVKELPKIHIIGAGLSGLAAALTLEKYGYTTTIIEKDKAVGGRIQTDKFENYHLDHGFQVMLDAYPKAKEFLDYEELELQEVLPGAVIFKDGKQHKLGDPLRNMSLLWPTLTFPLASFSDKLKVLKLNVELKRKSFKDIFSTEEKTTLSYLKTYGFSDKIIDNFFKPFFTGIFLEPHLETSSRKFEFVYKLFGEGKAVIPKKGIGKISNQLASRLKHSELRVNTKVKCINQNIIELDDGNSIVSDYIIAAAEAHSLVPNLNNQTITWKSCQCLYFECETRVIDKPIIGLVADNDAIINNIFYHTSIEGQSGEKELLSVTIVKEHQFENEELKNKVIEELKTYCNITIIRHLKTFQIPKGLPKLSTIRYDCAPSETRLTDSLFLAGDHTLNGSQNAALLSGQRAAEGIIEKIEGNGITGKLISEYI